MSKYRTSQTIKLKTHAYEQFRGIDTTRDPISLETGEGQFLIELNNGYPDVQGQIVRDSCATQRSDPHHLITHIRHINDDEVFWIEQSGGGLTFNTDNNHTEEEVYPLGAVVSSVIYNQKLHVFSKALPTYRYDGIKWERNQS
ncbi:hypothetical protein, partial [Endozoicomonas atrinae]|uniref:hypothetical protein n=1 Tax=Endozoicomonas atrinae TaxID=1333660 RepID=UPI001112F222